MELSDYRQELDRLDRDLVQLFLRRMEISGEIGRYKNKKHLPILDSEREIQKLNELRSLAPSKMQKTVASLYERIFELSREYQNKLSDQKRCGLLGETLGHSYSPRIHEILADYEYRLYEKKPEELDAFLRSGEWDGLNVTIPYKKTVLPYCNTLSETAKLIGSVNTLVRRPDGSIYGDNTDAYGFSLLLNKLGLDLAGKKAVVLGSGGASAMACAVLRQMGAGQVVVISRSGENNYGNLELHRDAVLLVNATPVGMYPHNGHASVDLASLPNLQGVVDLVYNPRRTALLMQAEARGIPCVGGLLMLTAQAKRSAELFSGNSIPDTETDRIEGLLKREMQNIALIGMPGCGKSSIARILGKRLNRPVLEADEEIEKTAGRSIPEIFAEEGEEGFRRRETQVLRELGKRSGAILSTGGGCVTREENYPLLHQNSLIIWRKRAVPDLPREGRPISQSRALEELYREREPLYRRFADVVIEETETVEEAVEKILEVLK